MKSTIKKRGNSAAIRIPAAVMKAVKFDRDEIVDVREEQERIIIEPVRQKTYELPALLKWITPKNQHQAADFGPALGEEFSFKGCLHSYSAPDDPRSDR